MVWDSESAKEAAQRSAEVRRRKRDLPLEDRIKAKAAAASEHAMKDLIDAAQGKGDFADITPEKRYDAIKTVLAYGVGKPTAAAARTEDPDDDEGEAPPEPSLV